MMQLARAAEKVEGQISKRVARFDLDSAIIHSCRSATSQRTKMRVGRDAAWKDVGGEGSCCFGRWEIKSECY